MFKKIMLCLMAILMLSSSFQNINAAEVSAASYILYDIENEVILAQENQNEVRNIASLTKLMGIITALDNITNLKEKIRVDGEVIQGYYDYTKVGLDHGDYVTYEELLYAMMLPSGADAALLINHHVAGGEEQFAKLMNQKAKELGMNNSHFDNSIGVDSEKNYSTASDLLLLLKYALKNETFYKMFTSKKYKMEALDKEIETTLTYYAKYIDQDLTSIKGSKTGYTNGAGYCLASISEHDGHEVALITLGSDLDYRASAIEDSLEIYDEFKTDYTYTDILSEGEHITTLPIQRGWKKNYEVVMPESVQGFVKDKDDWYVHYVGNQELNRDIKKGDWLGKVEVYQEGYLLLSYDLYLENFILYHYPLLYILVIFAFIAYLVILRKKKLRRRRRKRRSR